MEKLKELLNKWIEEWWKPYWDDYSILKISEIEKSDWLYFVSFVWEDYPWPVNLEHLLTKQAGLIKWLVKSDKIAWRKCLNLWYEIAVIDKEGEDIDIMRTFDDYEQLLMYLAIQDNPIEFLISILK